MITARPFLLLLALLCRDRPAPPQSIAALPVTTHRLSERVLHVMTGHSTVMSNITAIATSAGIVVIDSHYRPEYGRQLREIIEETFGRQDITHLILTHAGVDHMGGASAFPEALLIGHENCPGSIDALYRSFEGISIREAMAPRLQYIQDQIDEDPPDAALRTQLDESLLYWTDLTEMLASGFRYRKPELMFSNRLNLHSGDITVELCYCTPGYSTSDIVIHVPEERLLVTGDIFVDHRIPLYDAATDLDRWTAVFAPYLSGEIEIEHILTCHGEMMTIDEVRTQMDYLHDLKAAVEQIYREGGTLEQAREQLSFSRRYPCLSHLIIKWVGSPLQLHARNIEQIWKGLEG
jgi:glyoxylase-like metal-dependent hydrolase (beta-lactamase superfamily II)